MALSSAERQRRYLERLKAKAMRGEKVTVEQMRQLIRGVTIHIEEDKKIYLKNLKGKSK